MSQFETAQKESFPGAMPQHDFVKRCSEFAQKNGFSKDNTIAAVSTCRDEVCNPLRDALQEAWGNHFSFSALGGMIFLGRTGFGAFHAHAPATESRARYAYFAFPHIAIGADGTIGACERPGMSKPSTACGALAAFAKDLATGSVNTDFDRVDVEQSLLRARMVEQLGDSTDSDLANLTKEAEQAIFADLQREVTATIKADADYVLFTGIQIHAPGANDMVWPGHTVFNGKAHDL